MNILLVNLHSSRNAGDAALTLVAIQQLKKNFPGCLVTLVMNDPASFSGDEEVLGSFDTWVRKAGADGNPKWRWWLIPWVAFTGILVVGIYRWTGRSALLLAPAKWRRLLQAYLQADLVVSSPGGFMRTSGVIGLTNLIIVYTMALALWARKPLYIFPQSIGPLYRKWELRLLHWLLMQARIVMLREPISLEQLKLAGISHPRCYVLPDLGFAFEGASRQAAKNHLETLGVFPGVDQPLMGVTTLDWGAQNFRFNQQADYEAALSAAIRAFIENYKGKVVLFPQVWGPNPSEDDRIPARRIASRVGNLSENIVLVENPIPPDLIKACFGWMDVFIGTRMHSNIFALTEGVPVIAIAYQPKTVGIMQTLSLERWVLDIRTVTPAALTGKLKEILDERNEVRQKICQGIPSLIQDAEKAGIMTAADFAGLGRGARRG